MEWPRLRAALQKLLTIVAKICIHCGVVQFVTSIVTFLNTKFEANDKCIQVDREMKIIIQ